MTREHVREELTHLRDEAAILFEAYLARPMLRGMSHVVGFIIALGGITTLAIQAGAPIQLAASLIYGFGLAAMFGTSALYHRIKWSPRAHRLMKKLDHSMIYVLIASSYTPFLLLALDGTFRIVMLATIWGLAIGGVVLRVVVENQPRALQVLSYIGLGSAVIMLMPAIGDMSLMALVLLAIGGALYIFGGLVYLFQKPNPFPKVFGFHEVFHAFVVVAATCHFLAVWPLVTGTLPTNA
ncbi:MAG: hemolysin [Thermoleophilia bacterium]|nr:hemolysin [Thermoleophilia bacterium]MCZ4496444.1 hemolysin [Thermoleophilia bacterium]